MIEITSDDGKRRVEITEEGGFFRFTEYSELWDAGWGKIPGSLYWTPTYFSGLYDSAEAAEADAHATLPWLQALNSN